MKYRRLGNTEFEVSVVGVGTWQFGGDWGKDFTQHEVDAILAPAKELGINFIDTTECYGPHHLSESLKALKTDYIDLYQFHSGSDEVFDNDELWTMLESQVKAGKIRNRRWPITTLLARTI